MTYVERAKVYEALGQKDKARIDYTAATVIKPASVSDTLLQIEAKGRIDALKKGGGESTPCKSNCL